MLQEKTKAFKRGSDSWRADRGDGCLEWPGGEQGGESFRAGEFGGRPDSLFARIATAARIVGSTTVVDGFDVKYDMPPPGAGAGSKQSLPRRFYLNRICHTPIRCLRKR